MQIAFGGRLGQEGAEGVVRGVGFDGEGEVRLKVLQNGGRCEGKLQLAERGTRLLCLGELFCRLACQIS